MSERLTQTTVLGRFIGGGLFQPRTINPNDPDLDRARYSACIVLDKGEEHKIDLVVEEAVKARWSGKRPPGLQNWGVRIGDDPTYEASFGQKFINPKSKRPPQTLVRQKGMYVQTTQDDDLLYPGCYVGCSVEAYAYDGDRQRNIKPGVTLGLRAVLFRKHGERLDNHIDAEQEFAGVETETDDGFEDPFLNDSPDDGFNDPFFSNDSDDSLSDDRSAGFKRSFG